MPLVFGAIAPHGLPIIPELSDDGEGALTTRAAMAELGRRCAAARPDALVVASPHGVRVAGAVCLGDASRAAGTLRRGERVVEMNVPVEQLLTAQIAVAAREQGIPVALAGFAGHRRDHTVLPLDWGTMVPLWFLGHGRNLVGHGDVLADPPAADLGPPVVIVAPARSLPRATLVEFGQTVARIAASDERRVAFVASCDWAHAHRADGPFGFHPAAAEVDAAVVAAVREGDLLRLRTLDAQAAADAAIDGLWQALMLAGALTVAPMRHELLSYEAPTYYGMLVAAYEPVGRRDGR